MSAPATADKPATYDDISEFESHMPIHAVGLSQVRSPAIVMHRVALDGSTKAQPGMPGIG
jgi:hypothetical protein